jgi:glycosyltransferase involved in cell wall biosynthesis
MSFIFAAVAFVFFAKTVSSLYHFRWAQRLPSLGASPSDGSPLIRCSVVLAARNEEARIERTIRRLLDQRGVALEVIAVDDRSTDGTNEILRRLAKEDARVRVQRVESLPEGWLGKCHACHTGASVATGEWILFTDADCWLKPDAIARALRVARLQKADHVALTPGVAPETVGGQAWHLAFLLSVVDWISRVNHDKPKAYLGMGAFNLIRAEVYRACGGYEALRLTVLDDVRLGLLVRRASKRTRAFIGGDDAECHWEATARSMIKIMEKKLFRGAGLSDRSCLRGWPGRTGRMGSCGHGSAYRHCQGWRRDWLWVR